MATSNQALVRDASTLTNYKALKAISDFFITAGWTRSSDTGQVNWGTIATVPANATRDYEIFQPGDGLQNFYVKVQYGTVSTTVPVVIITLSTATNGAGVPSGFVSTSQNICIGGLAVTSTVTQWQCYFSGDTGRIGMMLWRDEGNPACLFVIERSKNASGVDYGTATTGYVTIAAAAYSAGGTSGQQSIVFGMGVANGNGGISGSALTGFSAIKSRNGTAPILSELFNGSIAISPIFPNVGYFGNPMNMLAVGSKNDFTEGGQYLIAASLMPYGVAHNYIASKQYGFMNSMSSNGDVALLMRYD